MQNNLFKRYWSQFWGLGSYRWVMVIWVMSAFYYMGVASDRYVPETKIYVKSIKSVSGEGMPNLSLLATGITQASPDLLLLQEYMRSMDMLKQLDEHIQLRKHYSDERWDFISRLNSWASEEDYLEYYRDHLELEVDAESGIMFVRAEAFTKEFSLKLTHELLQRGEAYLNKVGQTIAMSEIKFVEGELGRAQAELKVAQAELLKFLGENKTLSPEVEGKAFQQVVTEMRSQLVNLKAEEKALASFLNADAAELVTVKSKILAIEEQLAIEAAKLSSGGDASMGKVNAEFQMLEMQVKFATDIYKSTLTALEKTRVDAYRKLKHLVVVQSPLLPDARTYPRVIYMLITIFIIMSLIYGIVAMIVATVKEHRDA